MSRKFKLPPGTWVEREVFTSPAFIHLKGFAPQLLIILLGERRFERSGGRPGRGRLYCINSDKIQIPQNAMCRQYGITPPRLLRAIDNLLSAGFIQLRYQGGFRKGDSSIYAFSEEWKKWKPGADFSSRGKTVVAYDFCQIKGNPKKQF